VKQSRLAFVAGVPFPSDAVKRLVQSLRIDPRPGTIADAKHAGDQRAAEVERGDRDPSLSDQAFPSACGHGLSQTGRVAFILSQKSFVITMG
jgi:hypothetical protein